MAASSSSSAAKKTSAGLLLFRRRNGRLEALLAHPGGPFWAGKDLGSWSIPKGLVEPGEDLLTAARREFAEETGFAPAGPFAPLGSVKQKSGKVVHAWGVEADFDPASLKSNLFSMEWPAGSGTMQEFPEIDRAAFFDLAEARRKVIAAQAEFLDRLEKLQPV